MMGGTSMSSGKTWHNIPSGIKVGVILPSRGLMFSETADELLQNLKGISHKIFFSHKKPIPECFVRPTNRALIDESITHLWFVEDDMVLEPGVLRKLLDADANAITCDYPVTKDGHGSVFYDKGGRVVFAGTGCLLVKRRVFENLKEPYFTDTIRWSILNYGESIKLIGNNNDSRDDYGLHDVTFSIKLWKAGIIIQVLPIKLAQRKLISLGKSGSNNGAHNIEIWKKIVKNKRLKAILSQPIAIGAKTKLVTIDTPTGAVTTSQKHAENLVNQGLATYPAKRFTIIDDSEVDL
jgi:hypothetical protein